jgi:hypothetical protein
MHNMEFGQSYCKDLFKKILWKFILYFYDMYSIFYELLNFNEFLKKLNQKTISKSIKPRNSAGPHPAQGLATATIGHGGPCQTGK